MIDESDPLAHLDFPTTTPCAWPEHHRGAADGHCDPNQNAEYVVELTHSSVHTHTVEYAPICLSRLVWVRGNWNAHIPCPSCPSRLTTEDWLRIVGPLGVVPDE